MAGTQCLQLAVPLNHNSMEVAKRARHDRKPCGNTRHGQLRTGRGPTEDAAIKSVADWPQ